IMPPVPTAPVRAHSSATARKSARSVCATLGSLSHLISPEPLRRVLSMSIVAIAARESTHVASRVPVRADAAQVLMTQYLAAVPGRRAVLRNLSGGPYTLR